MHNLKKVKTIAQITPEVYPFSRTGGLAFSSADISNNLAKLGYNVSVFAPFWGSTVKRLDLDEREVILKDIQLELDNETKIKFSCIKHKVEIDEDNSIEYYFIAHYEFFGKYSQNLFYHPETHKRMYFFSKATVEVIKLLNLNFDIVHIHDWMAGLVPQILRKEIGNPPKTLLTIHNAAYQGANNVNLHRFEKGFGRIVNRLPNFNDNESWDNVNFLKQGIKFSDAVNTVSNTYAKEVISGKFGEGLTAFIKRNKVLYGIRNGIDYKKYNPSLPGSLSFRYDKTNFWEKRRKNKKRLFRKLQIPKSHLSKLLVITTHRLCYQKGFDYIFQEIENLMKLPIYMIVLGDGDNYYINKARDLGKNFERFKFIHPFSIEMEEKLISSADVVICASVFEPCGLAHMKAMRYGTIPVANSVGGLADSIDNYDLHLKTGTGFLYDGNNVDNLANTLNIAYKIFDNSKDEWKLIVENAMSEIFSWELSIEEYIRLYEKISK